MLECKGISKSYDDLDILDDVSLRVNAGELLCLLGANGAGKTTLINIFMGFTLPSKGHVEVNGLDVRSHIVETRERIAYIPENVALYPELTAYEHLVLFASGNEDKTYRDEGVHALETVGLTSRFIEKRVKTYSKGMRQKVGLALALIRNANVFLLDEPLAGLDPSAATEFSDSVLRFKSSGAAILMATHDIFNACEIATRVAILQSGRLVEVIDTASVTPAQLKQIYLDHMR